MPTRLKLSFNLPLAATLVLFMCALAIGCGGGGSTGSTGGSSGGSTTPDLGVQGSVSDTYGFTLTNASSGLVLGISGQSQVAGTALAQETNAGSATTDDMWHAMPMGSNQLEYNIENLLTHQVMGIENASTDTGATALQYADNGTNDHLWEFYLLTDGNYLLKNANSGDYLEDSNSNTTSSAVIDQGTRATSGTGCACQEWKLANSTTPAYPSPRAVSGTGIYVHDPYMLKDPSGTYWLYGTHQTLAYSTDLTTFTYTTLTTPYGACTSTQAGAWITAAQHCPVIGPDFASWSGLQTPPSDNSGANIDVWAPSMLTAGGTYYLYYAIPYEPSTGAEAVIGLATSSNPSGPWADKGYVVSSWTAATTAPPSNSTWNFNTGTTWNAIDPDPFVDVSGNWWMSFGSFQDGIHLMQLNPSTGLPTSPGLLTYPIIAARAAGEEGSFIYPYVVNGTQYYYYFASINVCCSATSAYRIIVGRSTNPQGPYLDRGGLNLTAGGGTIVLSTHSNIVGPGGQSVFTDTVGGVATPTLVYHYYDGNNNGTPTLGINRLGFTSDGWPYVE
ncbi:MAG: family 43 glycosylhydrolase [Acidobacteriaceae bacterium]